MEKDLKAVLFDELQKRGVSVYRFSRQTGISEGKIKGWKAGKGNPKLADAEKIRAWIGQKIDLEEEGSISPLRYIDRLERMNDTLEKSIQLSLNAILTGQGDLRESMAKLAGRTDQRLDEVIEALHTASEVFRQYQDKGTKDAGGKKGRVKP